MSDTKTIELTYVRIAQYYVEKGQNFVHLDDQSPANQKLFAGDVLKVNAKSPTTSRFLKSGVLETVNEKTALQLLAQKEGKEGEQKSETPKTTGKSSKKDAEKGEEEKDATE